MPQKLSNFFFPGGYLVAGCELVLWDEEEEIDAKIHT